MSDVSQDVSFVKNKPPKGKGRIRRLVMCIFCYRYYGADLHKHVCRGRYLTADERAQCNRNTDSGNASLHRYLYFNPGSHHFPSQATFTRSEVLHLLEVFGHRVVPEEFQSSDLHLGLPPWNPPPALEEATPSDVEVGGAPEVVGIPPAPPVVSVAYTAPPVVSVASTAPPVVTYSSIVSRSGIVKATVKPTSPIFIASRLGSSIPSSRLSGASPPRVSSSRVVSSKVSRSSSSSPISTPGVSSQVSAVRSSEVVPSSSSPVVWPQVGRGSMSRDRSSIVRISPDLSQVRPSSVSSGCPVRSPPAVPSAALCAPPATSFVTEVQVHRSDDSLYEHGKGLALPGRSTSSGDIDPVVDLGSRVEEILSDDGGFLDCSVSLDCGLDQLRQGSSLGRRSTVSDVQSSRQVGKKHKRVSFSESSSGGQSSPLLKVPRPKSSKVKVPIVEEGDTVDDSDYDADWELGYVQRSPSSFIRSLSTSRSSRLSSPRVVKAADKIKKKYRGALSSRPTKQYRYTRDVMKAQALGCGVYEYGWPSDLYWFREFVTWLSSERGKRVNFVKQTVARVRRCLSVWSSGFPGFPGHTPV